jgi:hypothetical protein
MQRDTKELQTILALHRVDTEGKTMQYMATAIADIGRPRLALVIGNAAYKRPLRNPVSDATQVAHKLRTACGFHEVIEVTDVDNTRMRKVIKDFALLANKPEYLT